MSEIFKLDAEHKKIVIFSDVHLSNYFDENKFNFIRSVVESADQVIINGDFWDKYECSWDEFLSSDWRRLFPILKQKKTIYLYGNHDLQKFSDERASLFSEIQADECVVKAGKYELLVQHGNLIAPTGDVKYQFLFGNNLMMKLSSAFQGLGARLVGRYFLRFVMPLGRLLMNKHSQKLKDNQILVCGHAHFSELSLQKKYINNGVIRWGLGQYLLVEDGKMELIERRY